MDVPMKNYSSGMLSRLAFAIATSGKADILIVDEVLAVGDFRFQQKCIDRIQGMMNEGTTVLFVSHSIEQVEAICNKVAWIKSGELHMFGDAKEICEIYKQS
jgi:ABC-2 type transport system ATP-binding protein/lipopolysaccharide transport system ATP-binding protein